MTRWSAAISRLIGRMASASVVSVVIALLIVAGALYGLTRVAPVSSRSRTRAIWWSPCSFPTAPRSSAPRRRWIRSPTIASKTPGVDQVVTVAGISPLDNSASLANAGVAYVTLKPWSERGKGQDLLSLFVGMNRAMQEVMDARVLVVPPPPIQGVGNASGSTMQLELRDGSFDFRKLQSLANAMVEAGIGQSSFQRVMTTFRSDAPQYRIDVDRVKAQTLHVNVDQVFSTIQTFMGSTYVVQFNKFGRTFQAYVQADAQFRLRPEDIANLSVRNSQGQNVPIGTLAAIEPTTGPPLISLYNLYPSATVIGIPVQGVSSGRGHAADGADGRAHPSRRHRLSNGPRCRFRRSSSATRCIWCSGSASCSSIWCSPGSMRAGMRRSRSCSRCRSRWSDPPSALLGLKVDANLYVQIGLILLIALSAKNAILIVEVARERRIKEGHPIVQAAVEAARARFRPILMTSIAFILERGAAGDRHGRGRERAQVDRHHGVHRHDRLDLPRGAVRALAVRRDPALRGVDRRRARSRRRRPWRRSDAPFVPPAIVTNGAGNVTIAPKRPARPRTCCKSGETHGPHLAEALSGRRAGRHRPDAIRLAGRAAGGKLREIQRPQGLHLHGQVDHLWRARRRCRAISPPICSTPA